MFWGSLLWSHFIAMISRDPFCLLAQCGTRVVLIPSGALYTLISCCMFLPEKQTKTWSEDETEQVCRQTETHWAGLASEHKLIAIQKIMGGRSHYDFQIRLNRRCLMFCTLKKTIWIFHDGQVQNTLTQRLAFPWTQMTKKGALKLQRNQRERKGGFMSMLRNR